MPHRRRDIAKECVSRRCRVETHLSAVSAVRMVSNYDVGIGVTIDFADPRPDGRSEPEV